LGRDFTKRDAVPGREIDGFVVLNNPDSGDKFGVDCFVGRSLRRGHPMGKAEGCKLRRSNKGFRRERLVLA